MLDVAQKIALLQQCCRCEIKMFPAIERWICFIPNTSNILQHDAIWPAYVICFFVQVYSWCDLTFMIYFGWRPNCCQPFWVDQTMQMYANFEDFLYNCAFLGVVIEWPLYSSLQIQFGYIQILTSNSQWTYCSLLAMVLGRLYSLPNRSEQPQEVSLLLWDLSVDGWEIVQALKDGEPSYCCGTVSYISQTVSLQKQSMHDMFDNIWCHLN